MNTEISPLVLELEEKIKNNPEFGARMIGATATATTNLSLEEIALILSWIEPNHSS